MKTQMTPEHIAHALWQQRNKFRALHQQDFSDEMTLLQVVRNDVRTKMYHDEGGAVSFYRDLNTVTLQEKLA